MRRRLALLMATVLCVTSVPQVSLIGMAAEEAAPETELLESTEEAVDIGLQSDENLVGEPVEAAAVETEASAVQETLAAETEAVVTEAATEIQTEEPATEVIPEQIQSEAETTEAPQETETTVSETVSTETAVTETTAPETEVPVEIETEVPETEKVKENAEPEAVAVETAESESEIALQDEYKIASLGIETSLPIYVLEKDYSFNSRGFNLRITYESGYETVFNLSYNTSDWYGHEITTKIYKADGTETSYRLNSSYLSEVGAGDYYLEASCGGKTVRQNFKIVSLEALKDSAEELHMGSNSVIAGYDNFYLYHLRLAEDAKITFQGDQKGDLCLFSRNEGADHGEWTNHGGAETGFGINIYGKCDYYFFSCSKSKEDISTELTIMEQPVITNIKKIDGQEEFLEKLETDSITQNLTIKLSYENQPDQQLSFSGRNSVTDSYGNHVACKVLDGDGEEKDFYAAVTLPIGEYRLVLYDDAGTSCEIPIRVVDPKEKITEELSVDKLTNATLRKGQYQWFKLKAEDGYIYTCDVKKDGQNFWDSVARLYDEDYNLVSYSLNSEELKKGTYYFGIASYNTSSADVTLEIQMKKKLESIEVIPGTLKYPENIYTEHFTDWKFKLKYANGTEEVVKLNEGTSNGYWTYVDTVKKGTENRWNYSDAEAGEYTVSFFCDSLRTEEYTFYQVPYEEYVDYIATPWELDKEEKIPAGQKVYLSYRVPEGAGGYYNLLFGRVNGDITICDESGDTINSVDGYYLEQDTYHLEASKTYLFELKSYGENDKTAILQKVPVWNMEDSLTVKNHAVYLVTPVSTSKYRFHVVDQVQGEELEEGYDINFIDTENNFYFYGKLVGGKQYLLILDIWKDKTENPCTVTAEPIVCLDSIDVSVDYSKLPELVEYISGVNLNGDGIKITAHYSNGTSEEVTSIYANGNRTDSMNHNYYVQLKKDGKRVRDTKKLSAGTYTVEVYTWDDEKITGNCELTIKSIKEVTEKYGVSLISGTAQKLKKENLQPASYYSFTAEATGRYEFEFSSLIDNLVVTDENGQKMTGMTISDKGYQFSLNQGQTYYFAVVGGMTEKTVTVTKAVDVTKVDLQIENAASHIGGIDMLKAKEVELKITYDNNETASIKGGEKDAYGNYFRLKASRVGEEYDYKLRTGGAIALYEGDYTVSASLRNEEECIGNTVLSVNGLNLEAQTKVKAGEAFSVNGGREFFSITPETSGKYYVEQAPYGSSLVFKAKYGESWGEVYPSGTLEAGKSYLIQYEGNAGKVLIKTAPEVTNISLESTEKPVEYLDTANKYMSELALIVEYAGGRKEKVYDKDSYGNVYERELRTSSGNFVANSNLNFTKHLKAGSYSLLLSGGGISLTNPVPVEVQSIKEQAQNLILAPETATVVEKDENQHAVFFAYKAVKDGRQELAFSNKVNDLAAVDENGEKITLFETEDGHYTFNLKAGATAYFAVDTDVVSASVTVKSIVNVTGASLRTKSNIYYQGLDYLGLDDLELTANYTDNSNQIVEGDYWTPFRDSYGNRFRFVVKTPSGRDAILSGSSIYLNQGEYTVNAYLNEEEDVLASTTVQAQEIKLNELPEIFAGETFKVKGNREKELFQFTPEENGNYNLANDSEGIIEFRRYYEEGWNIVNELKKGQTYLGVYQGDGAADETILKKGSSSGGDLVTSTGGTLEVGKSYDLSIGKAGDVVYFTFVPEESGIYCLETMDERQTPVYFKLYENLKNVFSGVYTLRYELKAGVKYTVKAGCYNEGIGKCKIAFSKENNEKVKPSNIELATVSGEKTVLGIRGIHTPEKILSQLELFIQYGENEGAYWNELSFGENEDGYGNAYKISVTNEAEDASEYQITVSCGELKASVKVILAQEDSLELVSLDEERTVNFEETGEVRQKYYRFVPERSAYYYPTILGKESTSSWQVKDMAGDEVSYKDSQKGYYLRAGETYYLGLSWGIDDSGSAKFAVKKSNPLKSMKLIQGPTSDYCVYSLVPARPDGAVFELTYADGTIKNFGYDEVDEDGNEVVCTGKFLNSKTYVHTYEYCGFYAEYEVPVIAMDELPLLTEKQNVTAAFDGKLNWERRAFRVQVTKDGRYTEVLKNANNTFCTWYDSSLDYLYGEEAYELEAGETYYLVLKANCEAAATVEISLKVAEESCEHEYVWVVDKEASCTEEGKRHEECKLCHESKNTETIPKTAHKYQLIVDSEATCGVAGSQHEECSVCHTKKAATTIAATGRHNYQTIVDKGATCGEAGSQHEECSVCHTKKAATTIAATGKHNYQTIVDKAATCGAAGSQHRECTVCHTKEAATAIPATGKHTYGAYKTVKAATVFAAGTEERNCSVCGNKESRSIKKLTAKISVSYKSVSVVAGSSVAAPKVTYANGDKITSWKTSNKAVATVDKNGKITGKKAGTATITVTLKSKKSAKIKVTVKKKVAAVRVKLNKTSLTLKKGKSFQLKVTVTPKNTTDKVTYKTSNKNIVTVTSKGKLVAKKKGKATITITVGKKKAACRVTVK